MNPSIRWLKLLTEIDIRPGQTAEQLAQRFEVNERTIRRDLEKIEAFGYPVVSEQGYRFLTKPFLRPLALTGTQQVAILIAFELASAQLDLVTRSELLAVADKIHRGLSDTERLKTRAISQVAKVELDPETQADMESGCLQPLTEAIDGKKVVSFFYQGRKDATPRVREVEPIGITFKNKRWYVLAFDPKDGRLKSFRFSRLQELAVTNREFQERDGVKVDDADFHEWDIGGEAPVEIRMRCSESLTRWFEENKPHPSVRTSGQSTVCLTVFNLESFLKWFASLDDAVLESPPEAVATLKERLLRVHNLYS